MAERLDGEAAAGAVYRLATAFYASQAVFAAAELGLADLLRDGSRTSAELSTATDTDPQALSRLLRMLASADVLVEGEDGSFALTAVGEALRSDAEHSLRDFTRLLAGPLAQRAWGGLLDSLRTSEPQLGDGLFAYLTEHPEMAGVYDGAMSSVTKHFARALAAAYDFGAFHRIVDVGGGQGELLIGLLRANPSLRGTLLERPPVVDGARAKVAAAGLTDRCDVIGGDFLQQVPAGADAYVLRGVILNWDDRPAITLLGNCRRAMTAAGKVLVVDTVMPEHVQATAVDRAASGVDLNMMVMLGGRIRTENQYRELLEQAGFALERIVTVGQSPSGSRVHSVLEGTPA
jgi:hypothetical protein